MSLATYLKKKGVTTGPRPKPASHSSMEINKTLLLGEPVSKIDAIYLRVGAEVHRRMEGKRPIKKSFTDEELVKIDAMVIALRSHPVVQQLTKGAKLEQRVACTLNGQKVTVILDVQQTTTGADYKTTICKTLADFISKAIEYGYIRQGLTYKLGRRLRKFYFIGVQKEPPYNVYVMDLDAQPAEVAYAMQELAFLLYFYKHYGKINN